MKEVSTDIHSFSDRVDAYEASVSSLENRVAALERSQSSQVANAIDLQLHLEDLEDHSRHNNLRLQGLPEATGTEDLAATVTVIFHKVMEARHPP